MCVNIQSEMLLRRLPKADSVLYLPYKLTIFLALFLGILWLIFENCIFPQFFFSYCIIKKP